MNILSAKLRELLPRGGQPSVNQRQVIRISFDRAVGETADFDSLEEARTGLIDDAPVIDNNHPPALPRDPNGAHVVAGGEAFVRT